VDKYQKRLARLEARMNTGRENVIKVRIHLYILKTASLFKKIFKLHQELSYIFAFFHSHALPDTIHPK
jgi:hypothetical protein